MCATEVGDAAFGVGRARRELRACGRTTGEMMRAYEEICTVVVATGVITGDASWVDNLVLLV